MSCAFSLFVHVETTAMQDIYTNHIRHGSCKPGTLWKLGVITKSGLTSDWAAVAREHHLLTDILDASDGELPKYSCLRTNLRKWLTKHDKDYSKWGENHVEGSSYALNVMFRSLRNLKVQKRCVPRRYKCLETVLAKIKVGQDVQDVKDEEHEQDDEQVDEQDVKNVVELSSEDESETGVTTMTAKVGDVVDWDNLEDAVIGIATS